MSNLPVALDSIFGAAPVIPVIVIENARSAVPLGQALLRGGLCVIEVTLRTAAALDALRALSQLPGAIVGAGTVLSAAQYDDAIAAGARFVVSPGLTASLRRVAANRSVPLLPGVATASDVMRAREAGFRLLKLFPAEAIGGVATLKAFASVFPDVRFCPTGGISAHTAAQYLAQENVACVGGSWLTPADAIAAGDWSRIERLAQQASALRR
jgi:2-dehydro-3-deoxyphosphogluconate aldolase/(4S)-4-hydroxy-2-oxoglutarate aldolase